VRLSAVTSIFWRMRDVDFDRVLPATMGLAPNGT
jgi:hypothetical protein